MGRTIRLFRLFLAEQSDPEKFYAALAADSVRQAAEFTPLAGRVVVDVGGGPGHFTREFRSRGASCVLVEPDSAELHARGNPPPGAVRGDGMRLPVADSAADVCFSSNVLEHVRAPLAMLDEMIRVTRPGGVVYLAFTNWYSPWGGHEMSPWHYLGARHAEQRYTRRTDRKPKHQVGTTLFPVHVGQMLRAVRSRPDVSVLAARPRYYPRWCRGLVRIPALREVATWNLLLVLRREPDRGSTIRQGEAPSRPAVTPEYPLPTGQAKGSAPVYRGELLLRRVLGRMLIRLRRLAGRPWVRLALLAVVLLCCGYRLHALWPQITSALDRMHWYSISLSIAAAIAGSVCMMLAWRAVLADLGSPLPARLAGRINFTAQLGKYVPGAVWAFAAQVELGHDYQVPRRRSFASVVVSLAVTVGVGLGLALVTLPAASPETTRHYWWVLAVLPLVIAALCPPVLGSLLDGLLAVLHRAPVERRPSFRGLAKAVGWNLAGWLMLGLQVWILLPGIAGLHGRTLLLCVGGYALAFSAGLLLVVLPSGIGARDLILIAALATLLPYGSASAIAIMTRIGTTITDLALGAVGIALGRMALKPSPAAAAAADEPSGQPAAAAAANGLSG